MENESRVAKYLRKHGWQYAYAHKQGCITIVKWRSPNKGRLWSQCDAYNMTRQTELARERAEKAKDGANS